MEPILFDNPDFIYAADIHIRSNIPKCRIDDFLEAQEYKLWFLFKQSEKYNCPIIIGGDLGHKPEWKNWLLSVFIQLCKKHDQPIYVIPGQHDLPFHNIYQWKQSALAVLHFTKKIIVLIYKPVTINDIQIIPCCYGQKIPSTYSVPFDKIIKRNILVTHRMIINKPLWPGQLAQTGIDLLHKYPSYDAILSGDNHQSFIFRDDNRLLVNAGSFMRTTTEQINHKPKIYLYYSKQNTVSPIYLPIEKNVINTEHIAENNDREKRIQSYINYIDNLKNKKKYSVVLSFKRNIENYLNKSKHHKSVKKLVRKHTEI
jgi:DNA repair exonuclease SbcCD nuclease subunit